MNRRRRPSPAEGDDHRDEPEDQGERGDGGQRILRREQHRAARGEGAAPQARPDGHTGIVQEALGVLIFVVVALAAVAALASLAGRDGLYDQIGRGGLSRDSDAPRPATAGSPAASAEQEEEIRQMLDARNTRRRRRGEPPLDVEGELRRLTAPAADPGLEAEVRQLVLARNDRRARQGREPLDVEAEVARQLRGLG
jgi:hypothetical protein